MFRIFLKAWTLGLTAYALVYTREVPTAYAQTVVDTDCSTDLDQPDTTYRLTADVPGNCIIAADNIILDGQSLYTISGNVNSTTTATVDFTVRNVTVGGDVENYGLSNDAGDVTVENSEVQGFVRSYSYNSDGGNVAVTGSDISGHVNSGSAYGNSGNVAIADSTVGSSINIQYGDITVTDSYIDGEVNRYDGGGTTTITNSIVAGDLSSYTGYVVVTDSTIEGHINRPYDAIVERSRVYGYVRSTRHMTIIESVIDAGSDLSAGNAVEGYTTCDITDTTVSPAVVFCGALNLVDNAPSLTVTPLTITLSHGELFNPFSGIVADDVKDGDLSDAVSVIGTVGDEEGVYELIYSVTDAGTSLSNTAHSETVTAGPSAATTTRTVTRGAQPAQSTSVGVHKDRKEKVAAEALRITPTGDINGTLIALKTVLGEPVTTNNPEQLKQILNLLLQIAAALMQLLAVKQ